MGDGGRSEPGGRVRRAGGGSLRRYLPLAGIALAVVGLVGGLAWLILRGMDAPAPLKQKPIQQVQILRPPPPPPEAPPPPPEPEEVDVPEPDEPEPEPEEAAQPPAGELGLDAEGVAGADGFGLLARKGGRDLLGSGSGDQYRWYGQVLKDDLINKLAEMRDIRRDRYAVEVRIWLAPDGRIQRFRVLNSTGNKDLDQDLVAALESLDRVSETPPDGLPQPVRLRIVSRT